MNPKRISYSFLIRRALRLSLFGLTLTAFTNCGLGFQAARLGDIASFGSLGDKGSLTDGTALATSPTQAILRFQKPGASPCRIEVSQNSNYSPLIHDIDPNLFPGDNSSDRANSVVNGTTVVFILGKRKIERGADGRKYSRALQQDTTHYYRITCGLQTVSGIFRTKILPFGATYQDLMPLNSDGSYNFPDTTSTDRSEEIVDSQTGVLIKRVNLPSDNITNSAPAPTYGGFGEYCNHLIDAHGFYHCLFNDSGGGIYPNFYALHPITGEVRFLGSAYIRRSEIDPAGVSIVGMAGGGESVMFESSDPNVVYAGVGIGARSTIVKWTYLGSDDPVTNSGSAPTQAAHKVEDLLGGASLNDLAAQFDPRFDLKKFTCVAVTHQNHYFLLHCPRGEQDSYSWIGVYDQGNGLPLGKGGNGRIIALVKMWENPGTRWCGAHSYEYLGEVPVFSVAVHPLSNQGVGKGIYSATLSGLLPSGNSGDLSDVTVWSSWDTQNWGPPPSQWSSGELTSKDPDHFLMSLQTGDMLRIDDELVRLKTKVSASSWILERGLGGSRAVAHSAGTSISSTCENANDPLVAYGGYLWWDFIDSPDGRVKSDWVINIGAHPVSRGQYRVDTGYPIRVGAVTDKSTWGKPATMIVTSHPEFGGQFAPGDGNSYQKHASMATGNDLTFFDSSFFVGTSLFSAPNSSATTHLTGGLYQYHYETGAGFANGALFARKHFPTLAKTYGRALVDVSGPGVMLSGGAADSYKYCVANAPNECWAGSSKGDIFFNHPNLDPNYSFCSGGENPVGAADICIGNFASNGLGAIQFKIIDDPRGAQSHRPLSRTFSNFENMADNLKLTYLGEWAISFRTDSVPPNATSRVFALKVPSIPADDGVDRGTFVPAVVKLFPPAGMGIASARVKFGYAEQGNPSDFYCTSRREVCVATTSAINEKDPFYFLQTDRYQPQTCANGCNIAIPVYPLHTAYYQVEYLNASGSVVANGPKGVANEGVIVESN